MSCTCAPISVRSTSRKRAAAKRAESRYRFEEVRSALQKHWGLSLHRGGDWGDGNERHNGRWTVEYSRTGYIVGGQLPGRGHGFMRFSSLGAVVRSCDLADVLRQQRMSPKAPSITACLEDARGTSWLVTISDRAPRIGDRGAWLHTSDLGEMLREALAPVLDDQSCIRPRFVKSDGQLRLGALYTYGPDPASRIRGRSRLVTVEIARLTG